MPVFAFIHAVAAVCFYILAGSFFAAFLLLRNEIGGEWPMWWLQHGDLPLLLAGLLAGGLSIYRSVTADRPSRVLAISLFVVLGAVFLAVALLNLLP